MFEVPGSDVKSVHINEDCVNENSPPEYTKRSNCSNNSTTDPTTTEEEENRKVRVTQ